MGDEPKYAPGGIIADDRLTIIGTWRGVDAPEMFLPAATLDAYRDDDFAAEVNRLLLVGYARLMGDDDPESFPEAVERRRRVEAADPTAKHRFIGDEDA
jgi:hypothetical protein